MNDMLHPFNKNLLLPHVCFWIKFECSQGNLSECAKGGNTVAYKPKRGDALLFFDKDPAYKEVDQASMHTGCEC